MQGKSSSRNMLCQSVNGSELNKQKPPIIKKNFRLKQLHISLFKCLHIDLLNFRFILCMYLLKKYIYIHIYLHMFAHICMYTY